MSVALLITMAVSVAAPVPVVVLPVSDGYELAEVLHCFGRSIGFSLVYVSTATLFYCRFAYRPLFSNIALFGGW